MLVLASVFAAIVTFSVSQVVFRNAAITTDEHAYIMQSFTFSEGKIAWPFPPAPEFFTHEMMIMDKDVGWISRYPPGHAFWLIPGMLLGQPRIMVSVAAALSIFIMGNLGFLLRFSSWIFPLLLLVSPYFIFMNGTLLSHTSGLPAAALMLFSYIYWKKNEKPLFALYAGLAWSLLFINRTFTGLLIALPFALDALWDLYRRRDWQTFRATCFFAGAASVGVFFYLLYNYLAVNDPLLPTYLYYAPSDKLGFGLRNEGYFPIIHTFSLGLTYLWENMVLLDKWLFGFQGSLLAAFVLTVWGWHKRWSILCVAAVFSVFTGYVFFWFEGIRDVGPVYYFELLPFILLAASFGLQKIIILLFSYPRAEKAVYALAILVVSTMSLGFMWREGRQLRSYQLIIGQFQHIVSTAPANSMILVEMFDGMNFVHKGTSLNPRGLKSDPLMVAAGKHHPRIILDIFPDRDAYHLYREGEKLVLAPYTNTDPITYNYSITGTGATTGTNEKNADESSLRTALEGRDKKGWLVLGDQRLVVPGNYLLTVDVQVCKATAESPVRLEIVADNSSVVIAATDFTNLCEVTPYVMDFSIKTISKIEPRVFYGGKGDVSFGDIRLTEIVQ